MLYFAPWDARLRFAAPVIERRIAHCKVLGLPPTATPEQYDEGIAALSPAKRTLMQAKGDTAAAQWADMIAWRPTGANDGQSVLAAFKSGVYEYLFLHGGRAGGKSYEVADAIVELCSQTAKRVVCGREYQTSIKESSRSLLVTKIKAHPSAADWEILDTELKNKNGTLITFMGMARNVESAKSLEGCDLFWGEEAQTFSAKSMEILIPTIRESGSMLVFTFNSRFSDDPVPQMATVDVPEASFVKVVEFEDNPHIFTSRLMNDLRKSFKKGKRFRHVWRGDLDRNSELRIIDHKVGTPPALSSGKRFYGIDFGGSDPTAFVRLWHWPPKALGRDEDELGIIYIDREFYAPCRSNKEIVKGVTDTAPELLEGKWILKADEADPKAIGELNDANIPTHGASKGEGSVQGGLRTIADHEVWISEDCPNTIKSAENYRWKADRSGNALNVPDHTWSHVWDAVRYALKDEDLTGGKDVEYIILGEAS